LSVVRFTTFVTCDKKQEWVRSENAIYGTKKNFMHYMPEDQGCLRTADD